MIVIFQHFLNDVVVLENEVPSVELDILMKDDTVDILDDVFEGVVVFMGQSHVGMFAYPLIDQEGELATVI